MITIPDPAEWLAELDQAELERINQLFAGLPFNSENHNVYVDMLWEAVSKHHPECRFFRDESHGMD